jgi:hypothetical protein
LIDAQRALHQARSVVRLALRVSDDSAEREDEDNALYVLELLIERGLNKLDDLERSLLPLARTRRRDAAAIAELARSEQVINEVTDVIKRRRQVQAMTPEERRASFAPVE